MTFSNIENGLNLSLKSKKPTLIISKVLLDMVLLINLEKKPLMVLHWVPMKQSLQNKN